MRGGKSSLQNSNYIFDNPLTELKIRTLRSLVMRSDFCFLIGLIEKILNIANLSEFLSTI